MNVTEAWPPNVEIQSHLKLVRIFQVFSTTVRGPHSEERALGKCRISLSNSWQLVRVRQNRARAVCFQACAAVAHEQDANPEAIGYARSSNLKQFGILFVPANSAQETAFCAR